MSKINTFFKLAKTPYKLISPLASNGFLKWMPDDIYAKLVYKSTFNKDLDLKKPQSFSEKIQWLKLYYRKPEFTEMVDKYLVREYIADKIGPKYLIPMLGIWKKSDEINFDLLPNQFVLKCNHDQGSVIICKNKEELDYEEVRRKLNKRLKKNHYWATREWPYKNIKHCIICEEYMSNDSHEDELSDYKVLCFNGKPRLIEVHRARFSENRTQDFYDTEWNKTNIEQTGIPSSDEIMDKPAFADEMLSLSSILAANMPHIRVDWYFAEGHLYFSELTFYDGSGFDLFCDNYDEVIGSWLNLPDKYVED